ncbi:hypothetical protein LZK98_17205 [Sphingomonas cannabina]|uniref:DUF6961 family protein n=1 Tax=Sphingomonas cannabina TaxID=2899123 RepID=UPI001F2DB330|nr:hypothetical protein [Sphingomonas cannabina]UIJ44773.1 hypothetical protein LZK98_17205 [Sphingomonas cannabina]
MTRDQELWACALTLERQFGERAPRYVAERLGAAALAGDDTGVATMTAIAAKLEMLRTATPSA